MLLRLPPCEQGPCLCHRDVTGMSPGCPAGSSSPGSTATVDVCCLAPRQPRHRPIHADPVHPPAHSVRTEPEEASSSAAPAPRAVPTLAAAAPPSFTALFLPHHFQLASPDHINARGAESPRMALDKLPPSALVSIGSFGPGVISGVCTHRSNGSHGMRLQHDADKNAHLSKPVVIHL